MKTLTLFLLASMISPVLAQEKKPEPPKEKSPEAPKTSETPAKPALPAASLKIQKLEAQTLALTLANAVEQFQNEYQRLPEPTSFSKGSDTSSSTDSAEELIRTLKGLNDLQNPRKMDFLGDVKAAKVVNGKPVNGLVEEGDEFSLVDPWGNFFQIALDTDYDEKVENPEPKPGGQLRKTVIVWSAGPDGRLDTWEDNVCSWKKD